MSYNMISKKFMPKPKNNASRLSRVVLPHSLRRRFFVRPPSSSAAIDWAKLPKLLTIRTAATLLAVHPNTLRQWDQTGKLRAVRLGSRRDRRYDRGAVRASWERAHQASAMPPERYRAPRTRRILNALRQHRRAIGWSFALVGVIFAGSMSAQSTTAQTAGGQRQFLTVTPQACSGWPGARNATTMSLGIKPSPADFTAGNSAIFDAKQYAVRTGSATGTVTGSLDVNMPTLDCSGFAVPSSADDMTVRSASVDLSLYTAFEANTTDSLRVEMSYDGATWKLLANLPRADDQPGILALPISPAPSLADIRNLRLRLTADVGIDSATTIALDGVRVFVAADQPSSVTSDPSAKKKLDQLTAVSQSLYRAGDHPVLTLPKHRDNKFLFMTTSRNDWQLKGVTLKDAAGVSVPAVFRTQDRTQGTSVMMDVTIDPSGLHPGKYAIVAQVATPENTTESIAKTFLWGVVALDFRRATVHTGDEQHVGIGILDDAGKTICQADVLVQVTDPKGKKKTYATKDKSIAVNADCIDKGVTNAADYSFAFPADAAGLYQVHLEANTTAGRRVVDDNFQADDGLAFDVYRGDYPTRIFPPASYPVRVAVTPRQDFHGLAREVVPATFVVSKISTGGSLHPDAEKPTQTIEWAVDWKKDQTYYYGYTFDAPNISPALFTAGSFSITGADGTVAYAEPRLWQIASDAILLTDGHEAIGRMVDAVRRPAPASLQVDKAIYRSSEDPTFILPAKNDEKRGKISKVDLVNADGVAVPVRIYDQSDATTPRVLTVEADNGYQPGRYSMQVTYDEKGGPPLTDTQQFVWGVLVINPEKSIYQPGEMAKLGMVALDATGKTLCQADLTLTVTSPNGNATTLSTADGSIGRNYTCDIHSVTNDPDYSAAYVTAEPGTYRLKLTSVMKAGQARTGADDTFSIDDTFEVQADAPFDVSRAGTATRMYPVEDYTANTTIIARQDYAGPVTETIPFSFRAYNISDQGSISPGNDGLTQTITWTVDWKQGQTYTLSYRFDPPNQSPRIYTLGPLVIGGFKEARYWQLAADATKTWDGGGGADTNWSTAANWDLDTLPATDDSIVLDATSNNDMVWDNNALSVAQISALTVSSHSGAVTISKSGATITGAYSNTGTGNVTHTVNVAVGGDYTLTTSGTFTPNSTTLTLTGTSATINTSKTHYNLTYNPASTGTLTMATNNLTVSNVLNVGTNGTVSIATSLYLYLTLSTSTQSLTMSGASSTISGAGTLSYASQAGAGFPSTGTISTNIRFDTTSADATMHSIYVVGTAGAGRTIGGAIDVYSSSSTGWGAVYFGTGSSQNITLNGNVTVTQTVAASTQRLYIDSRYTTSANLTINGSLSCTYNTTNGGRSIVASSVTWSLSGNFNITNCYTSAFDLTGQKLIMTGANTTITGMGGGNFKALQISAAGTVSGTSFNITGAFTVDNGAIWDSSTSQVQLTGAAATLSIGSTGTIQAPSGGRFTYNSSVAFPTGGTINGIVWLDCNGQTPLTFAAARDFGGTVNVYNGGTSACTVQFPSGTMNFGALVLYPRFTAVTTADFTTNSTTVNVTAAAGVTVTTGTGTSTLSMGSGNWTVSGNFNLTGLTTLNNNSGTLTMNGTTGTLTSAGFTLSNFATSGSGTVTLANATHTFSGDVTLGSSATISAGTSTVTMTGSKNLSGGSQTLNNLTISGTPTVTVTNTVKVGSILTVPALATLSINSGQVVWLTKTTTGTITFPDTAVISGSGILRYTSSTAFVTTGTLNATLSYDATTANQTMANRTYGGGIEAYSNSASARLVYPSANTSMTTLGVNANAGGTITFDATVGSTQNYTITASSDFSCTKASTGVPTIITGTGAWTVGGSLNLTNCAITATTGNTLTMNGTGDLIGAGLTLYNLTIDGNGNIVTAKTTDLTVANVLTIGGAADSNNDTLTINSGITITLSLTSGTALTINNSGTDTINGPGRLTYRTSTDFPTVGTLGAVLITRFDMVTNSMNLPVRADYGTIEAYNSSSSVRTLTFSSASAYTLSGNFDVQATSSGTTTVTATANGPAVNITGNLTYSSCSATCTIQSGAGTWTVTGSATMTNGTYTAATNNTLVMNGTGTLTPAGNTLYNLTSSGASVTASGATALNGNMLISGGSFTAPAAAFTVNGNWTNSGGTFVEGTGTVTLAGLTSTTLNSGCSNTDTCTNENFYSLTINKTDASDANDNVTLTTNGIRVTNTLTITDGELVQGALNVRAEGSTAVSIASAGKWSNISTGDIKIGGNFVNAGTLYLDVQGNSNGCLAGDTDDISFTSTDTTARALSGAGTYTLYDVTADYLNATVSITDSGGTDGGHNTGSWTFTSCGVAISGTVYLSNESTAATTGNGGPCDSSTAVVTVRINGGTAATGSCSNSNGTYSITTASPPTTGDTIAVYLTSTAKGNLIFLSDGSADTGMNLIISAVSLAHKNAGPIGITNLTSYDNTADATNMLFDAVSGTPNTLTVNSNIELHIVASSTFTPVGTVTTQGTGDFHVLGTSTLDTATSAIGRNIVVASGGALSISATTTVAGGGITTAGTASVTTAGTPTVTVSGTGTIGGGTSALPFYKLVLSGTPTFGSNITVANDLTLPASIAHGSKTITMTGSGRTLTGGTATVYNLTLSDSTTLSTSGVTVAGTLNVANGKTLTLSADLTLTGSANLNNTGATGGTIGGSSTLIVDSGTTLTSTGVISAPVQFNATNANTSTMPARSFGGNVSVYNADTVNPRTVTIGDGAGQTLTVTGNLTTDAADAGGVTLSGSNSPAVNVTGSVSCSGLNAGVPTITMGSGTWTISTSFNMGTGVASYCTLDSGGSTLVMNGTGTLTTHAQVLNNLTLSGSGNITLASATHSVAGSLSLSVTTLTVGTSTIKMTGVGTTITGGGKTLKNLQMSNSGGTTTLTGSDLTVSGLLTTDTGSSLTIAASRTLKLSAASGTSFTSGGTVNGPGTLTYQNSGTTFPTGGTLASTLVTRFDTLNGSMNIPARTDYGAIEAYGDSANARVVTLGTASSQTITTSSYLYVMANASGANTVTLQGATYDPTLNVGGDFDFTGTGSANEMVTAPDAAATWTISGYIDLSDGVWTAGAETVLMNGTGKTLNANGSTIKNLTIAGSITAQTFSATVSGILTVNANKTLTLTGVSVYSGTSGTVTLNGTIDGTGTLVVYNSNLGTGGVLSSNVLFEANDTNTSVAVSVRAFAGASSTVTFSTTRTIGTGTITLSGSPTVAGNLAITGGEFANTTINGGSASPTVTGSVTYTSMAMTDTLTMGSGTWTVGGNFDVTGITTLTTTGKLVMNGTGALTTDGKTLNNLDINSSGTVTLPTTQIISGNLLLGGSGTPVVTGSTIQMTGTTKYIDGGNKTLNNLTISGTATLQNTDLTVSGTLQVDASKQISINSGINLTHSGTTLTLNGTITGAGTLIIKDTSGGPGAAVGSTLSSVVRFDATAGNIASTTLDARTYGGAVEFYSNAAGSPTRTFTFPTGTFAFSDAVSTNRANTGTITIDADTNDPTITITGATTIGANTTWSASSAGAFNVNGNYTNNGTFTNNSGTVTLAGASQQTLSGSMTGSTQRFNNLTITNASGTDPDNSPSVIFGAAADANGTLTAATASTKLRFAAGSTYTFTAINFSGGAGAYVALRSSTGGTAWSIVAGAGSRTFSYLDVKDSNACSSSPSPIDASGDGTNVDGGGNSCWTIRTLSVSLSPTTADLSALDVNHVNQAGVVSTVTTSGGYVSLVKYDHTLTSGAYTIPDTSGGTIAIGESEFGAATSQASNTIAQWSPTSCATTTSTSNATALSATYKSYASAAAHVSGQSTTLCLLGSVSGTTPAGAYTSTLTVVTTARF